MYFVSFTDVIREERLYQGNVCLDEDVFRLQKTSSRQLDQDEYIRLTHTSSEDVFETSSGRLDQSSRRLQDIFKTSSTRLAKTSSKRLQDVLQKRLQDVFKTSCEDLFKAFSKRIIKLNCSC